MRSTAIPNENILCNAYDFCKKTNKKTTKNPRNFLVGCGVLAGRMRCLGNIINLHMQTEFFVELTLCNDIQSTFFFN